MKKILLMLAMVFLSRSSFAQVNSLDTVVFDISQAITNGSYVDVPVSFLSDDTIVAVDFSFKYNQLNFICDSIIDLTTYLQELWYYNASDSITRFTSYSLQNITNDTPLVMIRFNTLSGQLCGSDLNTVKGYLNGDLCSIKVVNCVPNGLNEANRISDIQVYPNPANAKLYVESNQNLEASLLDMSGKEIIQSFHVAASEKQEIDISKIYSGFYFLRTESQNGLYSTRKIFITN